MPKKKYPYQVVLDARAEKKREARLLVESRREQLEEARARHKPLCLDFKERRRRRVAAEHALKELSSGPAKGYQMVEHLDYVEELKEFEAAAAALFKEQLAEVTRAVGLLEQAGVALVEAARDEQAAEKHLEGWLRERRREEERAEQKQLDEIGSIFHGRRQTS